MQNAISLQLCLTNRSTIAPFASTSAIRSEFSHARDEDEIQKVFENADVHAVLFDLDCVGDGTADGLEVLEEMRRLRDDLVLARSRARRSGRCR